MEIDLGLWDYVRFATQFVVLPIIGLTLRLAYDIRTELRKLNGRMIKIEEWRENHVDEHERERHDLRDDIDDIRFRLGGGVRRR